MQAMWTVIFWQNTSADGCFNDQRFASLYRFICHSEIPTIRWWTKFQFSTGSFQCLMLAATHIGHLQFGEKKYQKYFREFNSNGTNERTKEWTKKKTPFKDLPSIRAVTDDSVFSLFWTSSISRLNWLNSSERPLPSYMLLAKFKQIWVLRLSPLTKLNDKKKTRTDECELRKRKKGKTSIAKRRNVVEAQHIQYSCDKNTSKSEMRQRSWQRQQNCIVCDKLRNSIFFAKSVFRCLPAT